MDTSTVELQTKDHKQDCYKLIVKYQFVVVFLLRLLNIDNTVLTLLGSGG